MDAFSSIAVASAPFSVAQDVASAQKTVLGEVYYDSTKGVDYFGSILGQPPDLSSIAEMMEEAALTISGVVSATTTLAEDSSRGAIGETVFTTVSGQNGTASV